MTQTYSTDAGTYVLLDADGNVISKADVPPREHPVDDRADVTRTFDVDTDTDLADHLSDSPANGGPDLPAPAHDRAREALESVAVDEEYRGEQR